MRKELPIGTLIRIHHHTYRITGASIGSGGGSIVYPCSQVIHNPDGTEKTSIDFVLKECFPAPHRRTEGIPSIAEFVRNEKGEIVPATDDENEWAYLSIVKKMQNNEELVSKEVYRKGFRLIPVYEKADTAELSFDNGSSFHEVNNTYALMESLYNKGQSLKTLLEESGHALSVQVSVHLIEQILRALKEVHDSGYLHLDIQDNNLFIKGSLDDHSDMVSLIDFGSSRICTADGFTEPISNRVIFSTEGFTAPEILSGNDGTLRLNPAADLYSIGYLLLYLLTGVKYTTDELKNVLGQQYISSRKLKKLKVPKHLTEKLQTILARSLAPDVQDRYQSCAEMLEDVSAFYAALTPYRSDLDQVVYDAFICYKHGRDSEVAQKLQFYLEHLKVPMRIKGQTAKIQNVFVDKGELAACADMGLVIADALKNSGWLIVICSAETKNSKWVNEEINTFLKYHDSSRILPLLTEGEPEDVYPEALLKIQKETGKEFKAADGRESTEKKVLKKVRKETVNEIAAPILGTTFATLVQRKQAYRIKCILAVSLCVICFLSAFLTKIFLQEKKYQEAYRKQLLFQSEALTDYAREYVSQGRKNKAIEALVQALPGGSDQELEKDRPYYPQAQYALTDLLGIYKNLSLETCLLDNTNVYTGTDAIQDNGKYSIYDLMLTDEYLLAMSASANGLDTGNSIFVWSQSGKLVNTYRSSRHLHWLNTPLKGSTDLIISEGDSIKRINYLTNEIVWNTDDNNEALGLHGYFDSFLLTSDPQPILYCADSSDDFICLSPDTGELLDQHNIKKTDYDIALYKYSNRLKYEFYKKCWTVSEVNKTVLFITETRDATFSNASDYLVVYNFDSDTQKNISLPDNICAYNDLVLDSSHHNIAYLSYRTQLETATYEDHLSAVDIETGTILWTQTQISYKSGESGKVHVFNLNSSYPEYLVWAAGNTIQILNKSDGSRYSIKTIDDQYIKDFFVEEDDIFAISNKGSVYLFLSDNLWLQEDGISEEYLVLQKVTGSNNYYCLTADSQNIIKYSKSYETKTSNYFPLKKLEKYSSSYIANETWLLICNLVSSDRKNEYAYLINKESNNSSLLLDDTLIPDQLIPISSEDDYVSGCSFFGIINNDLYYIYGCFQGNSHYCYYCSLDLVTHQKQCLPINTEHNYYPEDHCFNTNTGEICITERSEDDSDESYKIEIRSPHNATVKRYSLPPDIYTAYSSCHCSDTGNKVMFLGKDAFITKQIYVYDLEKQSISFQIPITDSDTFNMLDSYHNEYNKNLIGALDFEYVSFYDKNNIYIYHNGNLSETIPYDFFGYENLSLHFSPDAKYLYALSGNHLTRYCVEKPSEKMELMLPAKPAQTIVKYSFIEADAGVKEASPNELFIYDFDNILSLISTEDVFEVTARVENAFYPDLVHKRYYTAQQVLDSVQYGYYNKLSLDEILKAAGM